MREEKGVHLWRVALGRIRSGLVDQLVITLLGGG